MRRNPGFGNCDDVAVADYPCQRNRGRRATVCGADLRQRGVAYQIAVTAAERGIRHHRHIVRLAPCQKVALNAAVIETVRNLISCAAIAARYTEEVFHLTSVEVGHSPSADLPARAELLEPGYNVGELAAWDRP